MQNAHTTVAQTHVLTQSMPCECMCACVCATVVCMPLALASSKHFRHSQASHCKGQFGRCVSAESISETYLRTIEAILSPFSIAAARLA